MSSVQFVPLNSSIRSSSNTESSIRMRSCGATTCITAKSELSDKDESWMKMSTPSNEFQLSGSRSKSSLLSELVCTSNTSIVDTAAAIK